ncbi:MAG TPA: PD-(D/E)XK nuclease family protein [Solirubrobacterales bacterium]|nr:PD-(D/E)XK nuclease family protein [Solirubrobacterales bacterium]
MPLNLIHGPPNSGRRGLIRERFVDALDREPVLVVPNMDDVFGFERELCADQVVLGGSVMTFGALFRTVATMGGSPPGPELTASQRLQAISAAISERQRELGPLRRSASHPGFVTAFERLLDELQAAGVNPEAVGPEAMTLETSAYMSDLASLCLGYTEVRRRLQRTDAHVVARDAIALLREDPELWRQRPLFIYGFDDLTGNQLELLGALAGIAEVTMAFPFEEGRAALAARAGLLGRLRSQIGVAEEVVTEPRPENTSNPLLYHLERHFGILGSPVHEAAEGLVLLRSAGERGEAEAIAAEVAKLISAGADPAEIAIVARDPARRGPTLASVLESYGISTALEAELPVSGTAVGGALIALLEAEFGAGRASDLLRYLRGPSGIAPRHVDWLERTVRRRRLQSAAEALAVWEVEGRAPPHDLARLRKAAGSPSALVEAVGKCAATMASRPMRDAEDGPLPGPGDGVELRAAAAISSALGELAEMDRLSPRPEDLVDVLRGLEFRVWSGPVEGRVRIASPYRLRAARFDHVVVASLQDGEFPRRDRGSDPFLSESQRESLGLEPRRDTEAEERYLFYACLSLPRESLFLSYRDSDDGGAAEARSPFIDEVLLLLPHGETVEGVEEAITRGRDLAQVAHPVAEAPSESELARAIAAQGANEDTTALLEAAGAGERVRERVGARIDAARRAEAATRAPGPLTNPAVIESLAAIPAYGGTTLEQFDLCSYMWFASHELDPQPLDPVPDALIQGGLIHEALFRLYKERPQGDPLPRPASLSAWTGRGRQLVAEIAAEREMGRHPAERAILRRVETLLARFLAEEAARDPRGFEPWLLEAAFGEEEDSDRPALEIDGWKLHGAIDRVDRDGEGRAVVIDYKFSGGVTPLEKFEEKAKLQLQLYLLAVAEHWGARPVGGLYHPLRATSARRPRGALLSEAVPALSSYQPYNNDLLDGEGMEELLGQARRRAGEIVARIRSGDIRRDPGPAPGLRNHDVCPPFCEFAPICRRDRAPIVEGDANGGDREDAE